MVSPLLVLAYVALAAAVGFWGRKRLVGFAGFFILSLVLTPIVMALVLIIAACRNDR
jgi:hypothetical protein